MVEKALPPPLRGKLKCPADCVPWIFVDHSGEVTAECQKLPQGGFKTRRQYSEFLWGLIHEDDRPFLATNSAMLRATHDGYFNGVRGQYYFKAFSVTRPAGDDGTVEQ